ncbi:MULTISPECIES: hypothetical protein [Streptomyces]|uniref:Uncharacterized protein n=2 Tax=Streptomyces TaxID=1883 RepID=A0A939JPD4_9ACTN|nr:MULTISPECIES: hypothetical protein [Streptomyces]MBO0656276.1 hypothetical protein [Streptomyces triculaminicus]QSY50259.1 hypothetical protein J3S04_04245 [Streptomyces griseocarneus]
MSQQPLAEPKGGKKWKKGCGGCAVAAALIAVILVVAAIASSGGGKESAGKTGSDSRGSASDAPAATKPRTVLSESGNGIKSTAKFTVSGDWDLRYTFDCSSFGNSGNFIVSEGQALGAVLVNALAAKGDDVTHLHDGGTKHLEINSECSWTVQVVDLP